MQQLPESKQGYYFGDKIFKFVGAGLPAIIAPEGVSQDGGFCRLDCRRNKFYTPAKSPERCFFVISAKTGIQFFQYVSRTLDPGFRRGDGFLRNQQI
jgi:hypothetical protein